MTALSEALGCDVTELIYGAKPTPYRRYAKKYILWTAVLGVLVLAFLGCEIWLLPYLNEQVKANFDIFPRMYYVLLGRPVDFAAGGALLIAVLSLWADLRLPKKVSILLIIAGLLCLTPLLFVGLSLFVGTAFPDGWGMAWPALRHLVTGPGFTLTFAVLPFLGATALFLGFEK